MEQIQLIRILGLSMISFIIALGATPFVLRLLIRLNLRKQIRVDEKTPIFSQLHQRKAGTPTMGGVIIWGAVLFLAFVLFVMDFFFDGFWAYLNFVDRAQTYLPLFAIGVAALIGLVDDWFNILKIGPAGGGLKVRYKIILYSLIGVVGAWWFYFRLDWDVLYIPFLGNLEIGWWYIPIFIFIMTASAFSANETDGLDGLLGGVALFAFAALTVVAFTLQRYDLATFGGVIIGSLLAFLWFNIYPAKFFMGDTGSMALGVTIGVVAMLTNTALFLPFFAIILVIESLSVIVQMISKKGFGRKIFRSTPIHHHFEAIGWPESEVTMRFWIISAVFAALGLVLFFLARL